MWYSILPPFLAIILAFTTRKVVPSLGAAIIFGGFLAYFGGYLEGLQNSEGAELFIGKSPPGSMGEISAWGSAIAASYHFVKTTLINPGHYQVLLFVPPMFAMVLIITEARGFDGIINFISKFVKGRKSAQLATATSGVVYFFDDYSNAMVVGSAMRPLTDRFRVSREKLAFLVDSTSAPIASLALISTWIIYEVGYFKESADAMGIEMSGYAIFLDILQYRFYCIFILALVFLHIFMGRDFGPMKTAEEKAMKEGAEGAEEAHAETNNEKAPSVLVALIPLGGLMIFQFLAMWYNGAVTHGNGDGLSLLNYLYWRDVIGGAEDVIIIFVYAAIFGLILSIISARKLTSIPNDAMDNCIGRALRISIEPCMILLFAWALNDTSQALHTDIFLTDLLKDNVSVLALPMIVFLLACLTAFTTGTSWGTMAILIPVVGPVAFQMEGGEYGLITMMCLGAVLDGAIFGDHCSPISDTTILSSTSTQCNLIKHVQTQMPYALLGATIALICGYLPVALGMNWFISFALGIAAIIGFFFLVGKKAEEPTQEMAD